MVSTFWFCSTSLHITVLWIRLMFMLFVTIFGLSYVAVTFVDLWTFVIVIHPYC
jgi:hypothetical protein